jgi:hypothetical protein
LRAFVGCVGVFIVVSRSSRIWITCSEPVGRPTAPPPTPTRTQLEHARAAPEQRWRRARRAARAAVGGGGHLGTDRAERIAPEAERGAVLVVRRQLHLLANVAPVLPAQGKIRREVAAGDQGGDQAVGRGGSAGCRSSVGQGEIAARWSVPAGCPSGGHQSPACLGRCRWACAPSG